MEKLPQRRFCGPSLVTDALGLPHVAALSALELGLKRHHGRPYVGGPGRIGEDQFGILFGPVANRFALPGGICRQQ